MTHLKSDRLNQMVEFALTHKQQPKRIGAPRWVYGGLALAMAACLAALIVMPMFAVTAPDEVSALVADMSDMAAYDVFNQAL